MEENIPQGNGESRKHIEYDDLGRPIENFEGSIPIIATEAAESVRQQIKELLMGGYKYAEGRTFTADSRAEKYSTAQEAVGRKLVVYYTGGEVDIFCFDPPEWEQ